MKRKTCVKLTAFLLVLILLASVMAGCGNKGTKNANGEPWLNSNLLGNVKADMPTDPKQDLYLYANRDWLASTEIPAGFSCYNNYSSVYQETEERGIQMLENGQLNGHDGELIQELFRLYMDMDARNDAGYKPIEKCVRNLQAVSSLEELNALSMDIFADEYVGSVVNFGVERGLSDSSNYYVWVEYSGLLLSDSAEYEELTEYGKIEYKFIKDLSVYMLGRLGMSKKDALKCLDNAIAFDKEMAPYIYSYEEMMSSDYLSLIDNSMTLDELSGMVQNYPLKEYLDFYGLSECEEYIVPSPDFFQAFDSFYNEDNLEIIKDKLLINFVLNNATYLDEATMEKRAKLYKKYFGTESSELRQKAFRFVSDMLPDAVAKEYVELYSSEADKKRVEEMCYLVADTYREMLSENDWLSQDTKDYAIHKLDTMTVNVGWPDKWQDYSKLNLKGLSFYEACVEISADTIRKNLDKLGTTPDEELWSEEMSILECNAFYDGSSNSINMLVGMMGAPFYYSDMPTEELYASLGAFWIGHEISHAFDSNGAQMDADGNLRNWWTDSDMEEFNQKVLKMDNYLDGIRIMGDYNVTGSNVDSEMIADMTGLQCALKMAEKVEGFDYVRFFEYYAIMNRNVDYYTKELSMIQGDSHPLDYLRVNVPVQQFEEFYATYGVTEGDGMYLAPEDRLVIW